MEHVELRPEMYQWAMRRSHFKTEDLVTSFPELTKWIARTSYPTLQQLEVFAAKTKMPIGYFFLKQPLDEKVPIPDYRCMITTRGRPPSPDLLETIYICEQRQEWFRDFARSAGMEPLPFVGKADVKDDIIRAAAEIRHSLGMDLEERKTARDWTYAFRRFIEQADNLGILVMVSGIVRSNTHRKLDPDEFRGFSLADNLAPLVFINGADTKAAQMFTLAHEIAHIWLGKTALSNEEPSEAPSNKVEVWCDKVAAELLVPLEAIRKEYNKDNPLPYEMKRLAKCFKVSTLVILRRIHDAGGLSRAEMWDAYQCEAQRLIKLVHGGSGGNFYPTQIARVGKRFTQALIMSTLEGQTLYTDAFHLFGFSKLETFNNLAKNVGVF